MAIDRAAQRTQFGGFKFGAAFFGWIVAMGIAAMLMAVLSVAGIAAAFSQGAPSIAGHARFLGLISAAIFVVALGVAYYAGGYVAGRMTRFDGGRQGLGVWVLGIVLSLILSLAGFVLGSSYNLLQRAHVPFIGLSAQTLTIGGAATLLLAIILTCLAAMAGGKLGERYHRRVDEAGIIPEEPEFARRPVRRPGSRFETSFGERIERRDRR